VFTNFGRLGATVRDRNLLFSTLLGRIPAADRDAGRAIIRRGRPERQAALHAYFLQRALLPEDFDANGMTKEGCNRVASALFHAERWYLAERVGLGAILVRSVTDTWFLTWLTLSCAELGAILTAAEQLRDVPQARSDEHLRDALARARKRKPLDGPERIAELRRGGSEDIPRESQAEVNARLMKVARLRWRHLQKLGAATPCDLMSFDDPQR